MPFTAVPNSGQTLGGTRDQIRSNISALKASLAVNHVDLDLANVGKHKFMQMPSQAAAPATAADELALYVKTPAGVRLFLRQVSSGTEIQMSGVDPLAASVGYTFLPGGLLMQWGRKSMNLNSSTTITYTVEGGIAFDANPYNIQVSSTASDETIRNVATFTGVTSTQLTLNINSNAVGNAVCHWLVIGPKS